MMSRLSHATADAWPQGGRITMNLPHGTEKSYAKEILRPQDGVGLRYTLA